MTVVKFYIEYITEEDDLKFKLKKKRIGSQNSYLDVFIQMENLLVVQLNRFYTVEIKYFTYGY